MGKFAELADRCERSVEPDKELNADIMETLADQRWRDLENEASQPCGAPPETIRDGARLRAGIRVNFTGSIDAAMTLADDYMIIALSDIAADGLTACGLCSDTTTNPPTEHWGIPSETGQRTQIMARAICAAALRARDHELYKDKTP